jgi:hypothetical protein
MEEGGREENEEGEGRRKEEGLEVVVDVVSNFSNSPRTRERGREREKEREKERGRGP